MDIRDIIKLCGGAPRIADELRLLAVKDPLTYRIAKASAIYKWAEGGIPEWHWAVVMRLTERNGKPITEAQIYQANRDLERKSASDRMGNGKQRQASRVAA